MTRALPLLAALAAVLPATAASAQPDSLAAPTSRFAAAWVGGERADLGAVADRMAEADVVFLGERHDDAAAHAVQRWLLQVAHERAGRDVVLGLEMFEHDVQPVLDEYVAGLAEERDLLDAARPWPNYASDYRPLVEYARAHGIAVVATNAPARHVRLVAREGAGALARLPAASRVGYPPDSLWAGPSPALAAKFAEAMGDVSGHGGPGMDGMLAAQNLRDLTMAWRIAEAVRQRPGALLLHVNGSFHSAGGLGIPEHLARLVPGLRVLVVTMEPEADAAAEAAPGEVVVVTGVE